MRPGRTPLVATTAFPAVGVAAPAQELPASDEPEYVYGLGRASLRLSEWCLRELDKREGGAARLFQAIGHNYRVQEQKRWVEARREIERELALIPDSAGERLLAERLRALEAGAP